MPHENLIGTKGVQTRPPRAMFLIKEANVCVNCTHCSRETETKGEGYSKRSHSILVCNLFNCKVEKTEWCKNHKK